MELIQTYKVGPILDQQSMVSFCPPMLLPQPVRIAARPHESHSRNKHRKTMFCWCPAKPKVVFEHQVLVDRKPDARSRTIVWFLKGLDPDVGLKSRILDSRDTILLSEFGVHYDPMLPANYDQLDPDGENMKDGKTHLLHRTTDTDY